MSLEYEISWSRTSLFLLKEMASVALACNYLPCFKFFAYCLCCKVNSTLELEFNCWSRSCSLPDNLATFNFLSCNILHCLEISMHHKFMYLKKTNDLSLFVCLFNLLIKKYHCFPGWWLFYLQLLEKLLISFNEFEWTLCNTVWDLMWVILT